MAYFFLLLLLSSVELVKSSLDSSSFLDNNLSFSPNEGLSPTNLYLGDESSSPLVLNGFDPKQDTSQEGDLFDDDRIINPDTEDSLFDSFDESYSSGRIPDGSEIGSNSCVSNLAPSRKTRKRENADECSSSDFKDSTPKLPSLDAYDLLQEAQKRKFCSNTGFVGMDFTLVCAFSGSRADEDTYWHVSGYLCEFLAARNLRFEFPQQNSIN